MANKIQEKVINKLLDQYEKSKTFQGKNQVKQNFRIQVSKVFPKYKDDAEFDFFDEVNASLKELEKIELVELIYKQNRVLDKVSLNVNSLKKCYEFIKRKPKKDENQWLLDIWKKYNENPILRKYIGVQKLKIDKNQRVEYYDGVHKDYIDLLELIIETYQNQEEIFIRDLSIKIFHNSKRIGDLKARAQALMYQYGEYEERESVLEECGVVDTPTYVMMKGNAVLNLSGQIIELFRLKGDIALSTLSLKELEKIQILGKRVITVENLTSFHDYPNNGDFIVYLGGFHNKVKQKFLCFLYEQNRDKEYRHFGDIDAGGFYILEHLKRKTKIPFQSIYMNEQILEVYKEHWKELSTNDRKRLVDLLKRFNDENREENQEMYQDVIQFMLEHNCKLEQEAIFIEEEGIVSI